MKLKNLSDKNYTQHDSKKREFIAKTLIFSSSLLYLPQILKAELKDLKPVPTKNPYPIMPPGAINKKHFHNLCTACHLCISVCTTKVIKPSITEYGIAGLMQPYLDFHKNYCHYECNKCTQVCPTVALIPLKLEEKKLTQIGIVHFEIKNCIVYTDETSCGSCSEHCPTQAVTMVDYKNGLTIPETNPEICIGCGACEYACPAKPFKAIYVVGNNTHLKAKSPTSSEKPIINLQDDFPF